MKRMGNITPRPFYPRERIPVPIQYDARYAPAPVWTFRRAQKFLPVEIFFSPAGRCLVPSQPWGTTCIKYWVFLLDGPEEVGPISDRPRRLDMRQLDVGLCEEASSVSRWKKFVIYVTWKIFDAVLATVSPHWPYLGRNTVRMSLDHTLHTPAVVKQASELGGFPHCYEKAIWFTGLCFSRLNCILNVAVISP
jgi:hypothetical protein